jgi:hypothetical protein
MHISIMTAAHMESIWNSCGFNGLGEIWHILQAGRPGDLTVLAFSKTHKMLLAF